MANGSEGCPCINTTSSLASLVDRSCTTSGGEPGIILTVQTGSCAPLNYGSLECNPHDLLHDPICDLSRATEPNYPQYCFQSWCYVDKKSCVKNSEASVQRSQHFPIDSGIDLFYSYDTCNSTAENWIEYSEQSALGAIEIEAIIPGYVEPMIYKRDEKGSIIVNPGDEYYDDSIPYEGIYINYVNKLMEIANGDIRGIPFTHRSRASSALYPTRFVVIMCCRFDQFSSLVSCGSHLNDEILETLSNSEFTAAVQDIENGLVDMAIGPFWITSERLKMTAFTVPILNDKTVLVIPKPAEKNDIRAQTSKVLEPFSPGLWGLVIVIILLTALLSVWFTDQATVKSKRALFNKPWRSGPKRKGVYARLALDAVLEKGLFFFSGGVEQDKGASLPHKLLMFGFGFFILISVSTYVANLAAFLTRFVPGNYVDTMEGAVASGLKICAHSALEYDLTSKWPDAKFVFSVNSYQGMVDDYKAGKCDVMAVGIQDTLLDKTLLDRFCEEELAFTESVVIENPMAFPIRADIAPAFSYWMLQGMKYRGVSIQNSIEEYMLENSSQPSCNVDLSTHDHDEEDAYVQIMPANMIFPVIFWFMFSLVAIILQLIFVCQPKRTKHTRLIGRTSQFYTHKSYHSKQGGPSLSATCKLDDSDRDAVRIPTNTTPSDDADADSITSSGKIEQKLDVESAVVNGDETRLDCQQRVKFADSDNLNDHVRDERYLKSRIEFLMNTSTFDEMLDCFAEMKKIKGQ